MFVIELLIERRMKKSLVALFDFWELNGDISFYNLFHVENL